MKRNHLYLVAVVFSGLALVSCGKKTETTQNPQAKSDSVKPAFKFEDEAYDPNFKIPTPPKKAIKYASEGSPTRAIQDLDDMLDSYITDPKTPEDRKYNAQLKASVIHGTFDIRELCKNALDKNWDPRTPEEQEYFVKLMTRLLEKKAVFSKEQGQKKGGDSSKSGAVYKVTYEGDQFLDPEKTKAEVKTSVHIPSQNMRIELNYKLKKARKLGKLMM
ncbi:MAG: ABC transporter substrate-binding protein [Deltaproteobacteria bacterium]|nr:MAG: ABC transporter substrate-binding protein [Deltaproteobacteria bacterium]